MPQNTLKSILNQGRIGKIHNKIAYLEEKSDSAELKLVKVSGIPQNAIL